jgi:hypothetical protein
MRGEKDVPLDVLSIADLKDPLHRWIAVIAEQHEVGIGALNIQPDLHCDGTVITLAVGVILKRSVQENTAPIAQICCIELENLMSRNGETPPGELFVFVFSEQFIVTNDSNPIPARHISFGLNSLANAPTGFLAKDERVGAKLFLVLAKDPRTEPKLSDIDVSEQPLEAEAVILVWMGQNEDRKVRTPSLFG